MLPGSPSSIRVLVFPLGGGVQGIGLRLLIGFPWFSFQVLPLGVGATGIELGLPMVLLGCPSWFSLLVLLGSPCFSMLFLPLGGGVQGSGLRLPLLILLGFSLLVLPLSPIFEQTAVWGFVLRLVGPTLAKTS